MILSITECSDGKWLCQLGIQDGVERWYESTRKEAIYGIIKSALIMNGNYHTEKDIHFDTEKPKEFKLREVDEKTWKLLQDIKTKRMIPVRYDDKRLLYRITEEECEMILKIRTGKMRIVDESHQ